MLRGTLPFVLLLAAGPALSEPAVRAELKPLEFLVGRCWSTTFPNGTTTDTHCFEPALDGRVVRDRHVVRSGGKPYEGETVYAWDPRRRKIVYTYWASDGAMSTGAVAADTVGNLVFEENYASEDDELVLRSIWTRHGEDGFETHVTQQNKDGDWQEAWRRQFRRAGTAPSSH
jgi:hypothetical protein